MSTAYETGNPRDGRLNEDRLYRVKSFNLSGLNGISDRTLEMHFKLYEGYVREANRLTERLSAYARNGRIPSADMKLYSDLNRRLGFEYNGMILHEYYFGNLKRLGSPRPAPGSAFCRALELNFGGFQHWQSDFINKGQMRGVGWVVCFQDPICGRLSNHWITLHEIGNIAGFIPVLVMDAWQHAYLLDYRPVDREKYIDVFFTNVDWDAVERRVQARAPAALQASA